MLFRLILVASLLQCVTSYRSFQMKIPNGGSVPHPCKPNYMWPGVGHFIDQGTGVRNPFGLDFAAEGFKWTLALCVKDSDGDGLSNGEELGDPDCEWTENAIPKRLDGISHPGICDPWDSPVCFNKPVTHPIYKTQEEWMREECKADDFVCDGLTDPAVRNMSIRLPPTKVPAKETTYMCQIYDLPTEMDGGDFHMIAVEPIINNSYVVHHIVLFGCFDDVEATPEPFECGMTASSRCTDFISIWTVGFAGDCLYENMGIRLGDKGYKRLAMQFHWNNPEERDDWVDSSGLKIVYTPNRRTYDGGILMIGPDYFALPPGEREVEVTSTCSSACTKTQFKGPIYITMAWNHMHYAGKKMHLEVKRNNTHLMYLTDDPVYSYDSPQMYLYNDAPVQLLPGDELITTCTFDTYTRDHTTFQGDATSDEMCFGFLTYYPKQNLDYGYCLDAFGMSFCDAASFAECPYLYYFFDEASMKQMELFKRVTTDCRQFYPCTEECLDTLRMYKDTDPCMKDKYWEYLQSKILQTHPTGREFLSRVASCQAELNPQARLTTTTNNYDDWKGNGSSVTMMSPMILMITVLAWIVGIRQN